MKYYQCCKCKNIKSFKNNTEKVKIKMNNGNTIEKERVKKEFKKDIVCCSRRMRELSYENYTNEDKLNQNGFRNK